MSRRSGFTLVELMIVVAIIGILAAIAIPNFVAMQLRAKRAELAPNLDGIKTAEIAYEAAMDEYVEVADFQPEEVSGALQDWPTTSNFEILGWRPDGQVRGQYKVTIDVECTITCCPIKFSCSIGISFLAFGQTDLDQDGEFAQYATTRDENATMITEPYVY